MVAARTCSVRAAPRIKIQRRQKELPVNSVPQSVRIRLYSLFSLPDKTRFLLLTPPSTASLGHGLHSVSCSIVSFRCSIGSLCCFISCSCSVRGCTYSSIDDLYCLISYLYGSIGCSYSSIDDLYCFMDCSYSFIGASYCSMDCSYSFMGCLYCSIGQVYDVTGYLYCLMSSFCSPCIFQSDKNCGISTLYVAGWAPFMIPCILWERSSRKNHKI